MIFSRVEHDGVVRVATDGFRPSPGDVVTVIGPQPAVDDVTARLGRPSTNYLTLNRRELDFRRVAVSNHDIAGQTIADLRLYRRFGATATRVRRGDIDLLATDDLVLQIGDRVRIVAPRDRMPDIGHLLGDSERGTGEVEGAGFALGTGPGPPARGDRVPAARREHGVPGPGRRPAGRRPRARPPAPQRARSSGRCRSLPPPRSTSWGSCCSWPTPGPTPATTWSRRCRPTRGSGS